MPSKKIQYSLKPKSNTNRARPSSLSSMKFEIGEEAPRNMKLADVSSRTWKIIPSIISKFKVGTLIAESSFSNLYRKDRQLNNEGGYSMNDIFNTY